MTPTLQGRLLLARLQYTGATAQRLLVTSARRDTPCSSVARSVREAMGDSTDAVLVEIGTHPAGTTGRNPDGAGSSHLQDARDLLKTAQHSVIVAAPGLLDDPRIVLLGQDVDAVVVVVRHGRTVRRDLDILRGELASAGVNIDAAILL